MSASRHLPALDLELMSRLDVAGPRYTSYPTVPVWREDFDQAAYLGALDAASETAEPLSIYVHVPFCRELCTYCGCNVVVSKEPGRADRYLDRVAREIALVSARLRERRRVARVHLGGGTPTFLDEQQLARLWQALTDCFAIEPGAELAVEIDPVVTRREQLALLASFGFWRLSVGVQDFDPEVQRAVNRVQGFDETAALVADARKLGFRSVNADLIYGLPHQDVERWGRTLDRVLELGPDRMAVFSFAYVPEVRPNQRKLPAEHLPRGADKLALFRLAHDRFVDAGYDDIGLDHFARPEDELARARARGELWRDFQGYTTRRASDTVAFGVSGIGDVGGAYVQTEKGIGAYERALAEGQLPIERGLVLSEDDRRRRAVIIDLMCNGRVELDPTYFAPELERLGRHVTDGLVTLDGATVTLTPLGHVFMRNVAMVFDAYLEKQARPTFSRTV